MTLINRDGGATDALLTDLYLDALLADAVLDESAARPDGPGGAPAGDAPSRLDPAARAAADRLRDDLVRVHPSFRFEERLASRLAEAAVAMRLPAAAGAEGVVIPFRPVAPDEDPLDRPAEPGAAPSGRDLGRPLLIGGALTSAALSIAGAAYVAWRRGRPGRSAVPMVRAARAAHSGPGRGRRAIAPLASIPGVGTDSRPAHHVARD